MDCESVARLYMIQNHKRFREIKISPQESEVLNIILELGNNPVKPAVIHEIWQSNGRIIAFASICQILRFLVRKGYVYKLNNEKGAGALYRIKDGIVNAYSDRN